MSAEAGDVETALPVPLQHGDRVVLTFQQHLNGLAPQLRRVKAIELQRSPTALRVPSFLVKIASRAESLRRLVRK